MERTYEDFEPSAFGFVRNFLFFSSSSYFIIIYFLNREVFVQEQDKKDVL